MKKILVLLSLCACLAARAATNAPVLPSVNLPGLAVNVLKVTTNEITEANDLLMWIEPFIPSLTNKNLTLDAAGLYHKTAGFALDLEYAVSTNFALGVGPEYVDDLWYIDAVSAKLGTDVSLPVIGKLHAAIVSGLSIQANNAALGNQTMSIFFKHFDISPKWSLDLEGGYGYNSLWSGTLYRAGARVNFDW
jgi:hypothetical protein